MENFAGSGPFALPEGIMPNVLRPLVYYLSGCRQLDHLYKKISGVYTSQDFVETVLCQMGISYTVRGSDDIPDRGPLIIIANHPTGMLDGLLLLDWLFKKRTDVKVLANRWLLTIPQLSSLFCGIHVTEKSGTLRNYAAFKKVIAWLKQGGVLLIFPAGEVASFQLSSLSIIEARWKNSVARIAQRTDSVVLPVFLGGRNSFFFQIAGCVHPLLRTMLLPREFLKKIGGTSTLISGSIIPNVYLKKLSHRDKITQHLRQKTLELGEHS